MNISTCRLYIEELHLFCGAIGIPSDVIEGDATKTVCMNEQKEMRLSVHSFTRPQGPIIQFTGEVLAWAESQHHGYAAPVYFKPESIPDTAFFITIKDGVATEFVSLMDKPDSWQYRLVSITVSNLRAIEQERARQYEASQQFTKHKREQLRAIKSIREEAERKQREAETRRLNAALLEAETKLKGHP